VETPASPEPQAERIWSAELQPVGAPARILKTSAPAGSALPEPDAALVKEMREAWAPRCVADL
jgi:hypothetical protein